MQNIYFVYGYKVTPFLRQIKKQILSYLGKSGMYCVTFRVHVEMHVGIHAKC